MRLPEHLRAERRDRGRRYWLRRLANGWRGLYGQPVYLCGSALLDGNSDPRDWDIRIMLPDDQFAMRYGGHQSPEKVVLAWIGEAGSGEWTRIRWKWSDDCVKQSLKASRESAMNIDFQVYPKSYADRIYKGKPKLRIDTRKLERTATE